MTIGEALKEEREKIGMSKYQFSKGIIDRKFYSKVENNKGKIGSEALAKLLFRHHINIEQFWINIRDTYAECKDLELERLNKEIEFAVRIQDLELIESISKKFYKIDNKSIDYLRSVIFIAYLKKKC